MKSMRTFVANALIVTSALIGVAALSVGGASATSYLDPAQQASWSFQDSSLSNPNDIGVWAADITPDGTLVVFGETKRSRVRIINISTGAIVRTVAVGSEPAEVDIDSSGTYAWVGNASGNSISRVTIATGAVSTPITSVCASGKIRNMVLMPDDSHVVASCANQWSDAGTSVQIINLSTYANTTVTNGSNPLIRLVMSPTGNYVYASTIWGQVTSAGTPVTRIALPSGSVDNTFSVQTSAGATTADGPAFLGINGTGTTLYVASNNGVFSAWNNLGGTPNKLWSSYLGHGSLGNVLGPTPFVVDHTRGLGYLIYQNQGGLWPEVLDVYDMSTGVRATRVAINHQWSASITLSDDGETLISSGWRFSDMYKYRVGQAVTTTTSSTTTTSTTTTTTTTTSTTSTTTTTVPASSTTAAPATTAPAQSGSTTTVAASDEQDVDSSETSDTTAAPTTTTTTTTPLAPRASTANPEGPAPEAPEAAPGDARLTVNGSTAELSIQRVNNSLKITGSGVEITVSGVDDTGAKIELDSDGNLRVNGDDRLLVDATGFGSEEDLEAWLFSDPAYLGSVTTNKSGSAAGTFDVPSELEDGEHRLVLKSKSQLGEETIVAIGLVAGNEDGGSAGLSIVVGIVIAIAVLAGLLVPVVIRRRESESA